MMRLEVFLQSAALKILRQKLSHVSFSAGMYIHFFFSMVSCREKVPLDDELFAAFSRKVNY